MIAQRQYLTEAQFAEMLGIAEERAGVLRRQHGWPHLKVGKVVRYTETQIQEIERIQTIGGKTKAAAKSGKVAPLRGQTPRSAARNR